MRPLLAKQRAAPYYLSMHALVTGGCGFIGSHLVDRLLADGHAVTVLDDLSTGSLANISLQATFVQGDVSDAEVVNRLVAEADAVFHLAAVASVQVCEEQPEFAARTNIGGTETIFRAAAIRNTPVLYASSAAVYGDNPDLPLREDSATNPLGNYGRSKLHNESIAASYVFVPSVGLRFFNVYGPRQDPRSPYSGVISKFLANARAETPLTFFGDGEQTRDFIYVGDVVELLMNALAAAKGQTVYNGCTGLTINLKNLAQAIGISLNKDIITTHAPARSGDIQHSQGSPELAHAKLGFMARTPLTEGLAFLVAYDA